MKLITVKQLMKKSKTALIRKITKSLKTMPKKKLAMLCYEMSKSKLPRLRKSKAWYDPPQNIKHLRAIGLSSKGYSTPRTILAKRKTKRKFSRKQLAAQRLFAKRARAGTLRKRRRR